MKNRSPLISRPWFLAVAAAVVLAGGLCSQVGTCTAKQRSYRSPFEVAFAPDGDTLVVSDRTAAVLYVVDAEAGEVTRSIPLRGAPMAVAWGKGRRVYVAEYDNGTVAEVQTRTGKVLISRSFTWTLSRWRNDAGEVLPVAPVTSIYAVTLTDAQGAQQVVAPGTYRLERDSQRPCLRPMGACLPAIPAGGEVTIALTAGMAADWGGLPADLGQAVLLLATHYYEYRDETSLSDGCMPFGVTSLIQRYRMVRFGAGLMQ